MTRALVLGGGGSVGVAWETGLLAGLAAEGVDFASADYIVGTSAGSVVGAQLALGKSLSDLVAAQHDPSPPESIGYATTTPDLAPLLQIMGEAAISNAPREEVMKKLGAFGLEATGVVPEPQRLRGFEIMLGTYDWPATAYACTAVDALSGEFVVWDRNSGVDLIHAVASSCGVPGVYEPISIRGSRFIDGGMRSATNADVAQGHDLVILVAVVAGRGAPAMADVARRRVESEAQALVAAGSAVEIIMPGDASAEAFGPNLMDRGRRGPVVDAGIAQGRAEATRIRAAWQRFAPVV